ncbi:MAG: YfcC family protein [Erysipelotrichales bacterium]|nr:YfcC family protein [Erysipelotrichales bacterium]
MAKRKRNTITAFSILLLIIFALAIITWLLPDVEDASIATIVMAPYNGLVNAIDVCVFVLVLGGFLGVITKTGALDTGIKALVKRLNGKELYLIPALMILFALGGTTFGMCEETMGFYALVSATMVAAGFDTLVAAAIILLGAGIGCLGSTVNPFATGIASDALVSLGYEVNQGVIIILGLILTIVNLVICIYFVMRYASKVKHEKGSILTKSELSEMHKEYAGDNTEISLILTNRQKGVLVLFSISFLIMVLAVIPWDSFIPENIFNSLFGWSSFLNGEPLGLWWFGELSMWFFILSVVCGIVGGLKEKEIVEAFVAGTADVVSVILIIAVARGTSVLMSETGLDVYILNLAANTLDGLSAIIFAPLAFLIYLGLSFLIPSSSGCATATMPIMGPLAIELGYNPAVMIMVFSAANGIVNLFTPTSGVVMGGLQICRVDYSTWLKWALKVIVICTVVSVTIITIAMIIIP